MMTRIAFVLFALVGCTDAALSTDAEDGAGDSFLDGSAKSDTFGVAEGSPEAHGVLQLVNTVDRRTLRADVMLSENAVEHISSFRAGGDRTASTLDDRRFATLAELDATPYVGANTFGKLLAYAEEHGYVTPNPFETACDGPVISRARLQELTENGSAPLPTGALWTRTRTCSIALGCTPWSEPRKAGRPGSATLTYRTHESDPDVGFDASFSYSYAVLLPQGYLDNRTGYRWLFELSPREPTSELGPISTRFSSWFGSNVSRDGAMTDPSITFTDGCFRASAVVPSTGNGIETEAVLYATF